MKRWHCRHDGRRGRRRRHSGRDRRRGGGGGTGGGGGQSAARIAATARKARQRRHSHGRVTAPGQQADRIMALLQTLPESLAQLDRRTGGHVVAAPNRLLFDKEREKCAIQVPRNVRQCFAACPTFANRTQRYTAASGACVNATERPIASYRHTVYAAN